VPRPTNRQQLIAAATKNYTELMELTKSLPDDLVDGPFGFEDRDRNVRDVFVHLSSWQDMMLTWYIDGMAGEKPAIPAPGYTWRTSPALSALIWRDAQQVPLARSVIDLIASHKRMMTLIEGHTDEELFTKRYYPWTGNTSLGSYLVSSTASHYDWAITKILKAARVGTGPHNATTRLLAEVPLTPCMPWES
jgi:hypothetical protein